MLFKVGQAKLAIYPRGYDDTPRKEYRRPYPGEELYRETDVTSLLRISDSSVTQMHAGRLKYTASLKLVTCQLYFTQLMTGVLLIRPPRIIAQRR